MAVPLRPRAPPFAGLPVALTKRRLLGRMKKFGLDWVGATSAGVTPTGVNPHWCPSGGTGRAPGASNPQKFRFRKPLRPAENSFSSKGLRVVNIFRCCATISTCSDAPPRDSLLKEIRPFEDSPRLKAGDSLELLCDIAARLQRCFLFRRHVLGLALKSYRVSTDYHRASLG